MSEWLNNISLGYNSWPLGLISLIILFLIYIYNRKTIKNKRINQFTTEYFKGLNYLLNDEQGKALDVFVKLVETNWETIDTHFALGKIFRKNGEIDKAIKIHQGLIARPSLPEKYRSKVLLELGYDYLGAGWFDRAEGLFKEVLIHDEHSKIARHHLILIYQQEKDWHKAIDIARELFGDNAEEVGPMISQYFCELAEASKIKGDVKQVSNYAQQALKYDGDSVRATMILAQLGLDKHDYKHAIKLLEQVEQQDPEFLPLVLDRIVDCYYVKGDHTQLLKYLHDVDERHETISLLEVHASNLDKYVGRAEAISYVKDDLRKNPSLEGMRYLLSLQESESLSSDQSSMIKDLKQAVVSMQETDMDYQCRHCGFHSNTLYWLCPSCQNWGTVKPGINEAA